MVRRVPSYRHHKPSGKAVTTISGRDYYLGKYNSRESKAAYDKLIREWRAAGQSSSFGHQGGGVTIAMMLADYLDHCEIHYPGSNNSETVQTRNAIKYLEPYEDENAEDFGPTKLKAVRQAMLDKTSEKTGKPLSRSSINKLIDRLVRAWRWASENELVPITVYQALNNVRGLQRGRCTAPEAPKVLPVPEAMVEATLPHMPPVVADMVRFQTLTGCRPGEVCSITPGMIDRSADVWVATMEAHKTSYRDQTRVIYIGPQAQAVIKPYLLRASDSPLFSPSDGERKRRKADSVANVGNRYTNASYAKAVNRACLALHPIADGASKKEIEAHKAKHCWSPNRLRHAAGTRIRRDFGLEAAQVILGHSQAYVTQIYAERDVRKGVEVAQLVG